MDASRKQKVSRTQANSKQTRSSLPLSGNRFLKEVPVISKVKSIYIKCPYYRCEEKQTVCCENLVDDTSFRLIFKENLDFKHYRKTVCMGDYSKCPIVQALNKKYDYLQGVNIRE